MKSLVVYSSLTGNTRKIAEAIVKGLPESYVLAPVEEAPAPQGYDVVFMGFWVDKGKADAKTLDYVDKLKGVKTAFFFTLGDYPNSNHADRVHHSTVVLLEDIGSTVLGGFRSQGKVDPELIEKMKQMLPPDNPHAQMTPERKARLEEAAKHPNEEDFVKAEAFAKEIVAKVQG
ncbi:MAG: flavodoxin family protein [Deltaproteobacteria bacterium]|jgi:flavodoxin|nr:flavodoxin family protein [Deltaproteobacteria bacterium]